MWQSWGGKGRERLQGWPLRGGNCSVLNTAGSANSKVDPPEDTAGLISKGGAASENEFKKAEKTSDGEGFHGGESNLTQLEGLWWWMSSPQGRCFLKGTAACR